MPDDQLWVMGDNRQNSEDSRAHMGEPGGGFVPVDDVVGKVWAIIWPLDRAGLLHRPATFDNPRPRRLTVGPVYPAGSTRTGSPSSQRHDVLDDAGVVGRVVLPGDVADVRGEQRVGQRPQRVVGRQRLVVVDVERGAGDPLLAQRLDQRRLVDDRAAGGVDQPAVRPEQVELVGADQAPGAVGQRAGGW